MNKSRVVPTDEGERLEFLRRSNEDQKLGVILGLQGDVAILTRAVNEMKQRLKNQNGASATEVIDLIAEPLGEVIKLERKEVDEKLGPLLCRIAALEIKLAELQKQPQLIGFDE